MSNNSKAPYSIGLWGPPEAGKTMLLCQLLLQLERSSWRVFPSDDAEAFLSTAREEMAQNRFPRATNVGTAADVTYLVRSPGGSEYTLALRDHAGGELVELADPIKQTLVRADGLLVLMDSEDPPQSLQTSLNTLLTRLHVAAEVGSRRDPRPVAVCLTKIDGRLSDSTELELATSAPGRFVTTHVDPVLSEIAERWLEDFELFPISAAGVFVHDGVVEPATFYDEALTRRLATGGRTVNLMALLQWLIVRLDPGAA